MEYNIVTNYKINKIFKDQSKYFTVKLGFASTEEAPNTGGQRVYSSKDSFALYYNTMYKTTIYGQGIIGNIRFYTDHYITDDHIAFYYDREEFIFNLDEDMIKNKGVDLYLGYLIKTIEEQHKDRVEKENEFKEEQQKNVGNPDNIILNPGAVSYADIKKYLEKQNAERLKGGN